MQEEQPNEPPAWPPRRVGFTLVGQWAERLGPIVGADDFEDACFDALRGQQPPSGCDDE